MGIRRGTRRMTRGVAAPAFSPKTLAGLVAWYRADLGITIGTGVSQWADQSGTGDAHKNLAQATGSAQPTLNAADAAYNNKPTISFAAASSQFLRSTAWTVAPPTVNTIFIVGNSDGANSRALTDGLLSASWLVDITAAPTLEMFESASLTNATVATGSPFAFGGVFNGALSKMFFNAKTAVSTGNTGAAAITGLTVGVAGSTASEFFNGKIAEIVVYNTALADSDVAKVLTYLGARYGIAIGS